MTIKMWVENLESVLSGVDAKQDQINAATAYALGMVALAVEGRAKENASGRPGPNVRTGNLRNSIAAQKVEKGFGDTYTTSVHASMIYARAVEMGHPRWKPGVKYPYLGPAAQQLSSSGYLDSLFTGAFASRMRG